MTIDETRYAFGLDGSRYWSSAGLANFKVLAQATNPTPRFLAFRAVISWGYVDAFFAYHWAEAKKIVDYRKTLVIGKPDDFYLPVGRLAYGVIYPGEDGKRQAYHLLKVLSDQQTDWTHDRLVIDAELDHGQSPARITDTTNTYGEILKAETGKLPMLYSRYYWMKEHYIMKDLLNFTKWYAQYLTPTPFVRYRAEYPCPPNPVFDNEWDVHQTAERGDPRPYGVTGKQVIDYDRWNGGLDTVLDYFKLKDEIIQPPMTVKEQLADHEERIEALEAKV